MGLANKPCAQIGHAANFSTHNLLIRFAIAMMVSIGGLPSDRGNRLASAT